MFGAQKALLGGGTNTADAFQAIDTAISILKEKSTQSFGFFIVQLLMFHIASLLLMWILYNWFVAFCVNFVMGAFLILFIHNFMSLYNEFAKIEEDETHTEVL